MTFVGIVAARSSSAIPSFGPPGETAIQAINPKRVQRILDFTRWTRLAPGSLNLNVDNQVLEELTGYVRAITEPCKEVVYPPNWQHILALREEYWYYPGRIEGHEVAVDVLIRRAKVPVPERVEVFSELHLRQLLSLQDGDSLQVTVLHLV